jgi:hypothetical protein
VREDMLSAEAFQWLHDLTESSERLVAHVRSVERPVAREVSAQI